MTGSPDRVTVCDSSPVSVFFVALVLAGVAGFVDAVCFLHVVGVFPANQSGNAVFLGLSIGGNSPAPGWAPPVAIFAFMVGAAIARLLTVRVGPRRSAATLLGAESVLLMALAVVFVVKGSSDTFTTTAAQVAALASAAVAMGLQTDVIGAVAGVAVSTTYQAAAIARIGEAIATPPSTRDRDSGRPLLVVLSVVLLAYIGGAALGATRMGDGRTALLVPVALVAGLFAIACARPWS